MPYYSRLFRTTLALSRTLHLLLMPTRPSHELRPPGHRRKCKSSKSSWRTRSSHAPPNRRWFLHPRNTHRLIIPRTIFSSPISLPSTKECSHSDAEGKALNQARMYRVSVVTFYSALGIEDHPFFALVTAGKLGAILTAWKSSKHEVSRPRRYHKCADAFTEIRYFVSDTSVSFLRYSFYDFATFKRS